MEHSSYKDVTNVKGENKMYDIYEKLQQFHRQNKQTALVTIVATKGSTPRDGGTKMLVCADGTVYGTIGGSVVEAIVIEEAKECLKKGSCKKIWHDLDDHGKEDTGMICGGKMEFFIEPINLAPHLYIFGAGHVALPLARFAFQVGFNYTIIEDREAFANKERFPDAKDIIIITADQVTAKINFLSSDYIAIVTRSHEMDYRVLTSVLNKKVKYIGLIASKVKKKQIFAQLKQDGFSQKTISQIHSPIGLDIKAETPEEIAISIVAELIQVKNNHKL